MANNFDPHDGGKVSRDEAEKWMKKFDDEDRKDKAKDTKSVFFGKDFLKSILETEDCAGISFFFVRKPSAHARKDVLDLVLLPRKADGTLIWPASADGGKDAVVELAYDNGKLCPPTCQ